MVNAIFHVRGSSATAHISASIGGRVLAIGNYAVSGGAGWHALAQGAGAFADICGRIVTDSNTPAFSQADAAASYGAIVYIYTMTFTNGGTVTGKRYNVTLNGIVETAGRGAGYIPGDTAGTTATGGQYN